MIAVILVGHGLVVDSLESLLKAAGWTPQRLANFAGELRAALTVSGERPSPQRAALIAAIDLTDADRRVEQILGQCSRVRVVLVAPDVIDRETRRGIVRALRAGADDFVTMSALASELTLRLSAGRGWARRREMGRLQRICGLQLERGSRRLRHAEKIVSLTPCEYRVFACLARRQGHVVSRAAIQKNLARRSRSASKNMVDVYVLYLRRKLATLECGCAIRTIRGVGYALAEEEIVSSSSYQTSSVILSTTTHLEN